MGLSFYTFLGAVLCNFKIGLFVSTMVSIYSKRSQPRDAKEADTCSSTWGKPMKHSYLFEG